ncbi:MAG: isocitrate lyase/phosphoenolpyruvate mutase family protein [Chitinophagales bacterium]|nr:isocitrate lyase/phosphoenolpyruvate mutase family protein [Chitinophagales bacterium]
MNAYQHFKALHAGPTPLLIGNVWNVQSARVFERLDFKALATSSAAMAHALGFEDGEQMPFDSLLYGVEQIRKHIRLPLSVDLERGYGQTAGEIAGNMIALAKLGVVGINIEDSLLVNGKRTLKEPGLFAELIQELKAILASQGVDLFFNVRCDAFLVNGPDALQQGLERIKIYESAGADGLFFPGLVDEKGIGAIVLEATLPVNVMCRPGLPNFGTLEKLGVKRISMGDFLNEYVYASMEHMTKSILTEQSFSSLFSA